MPEGKPIKKTICVFSGLGADERVFHRLDLSNYHVIHVKWVLPMANESIQHYAARLAGEYTFKEPPILLGLSFGGIMAIEVSKHLAYDKIILISSVKTRQEIPFYLRLLGHLKLHHLLPTFMLKRPGIIGHWLFSTKNPEEKQLLNTILKEADNVFTRWALNALLSWNNTIVPPRLRHIHGGADRLLPAKNVAKENLIPEAGHFMILNKAGEIYNLL